MKVPFIAEVRTLVSMIPLNSAFGVRDQAAVVIPSNTGLRVSELCGLDVGHVRDKDFLDVPKDYAKGCHSRTIPLNRHAQKAIGNLIAFNRQRGFFTDDDAPLFQDRYHQRLTPRAIQRMMQHYRELAGLSELITPHSLRHFFATRCLARGASVRAVQILLGHRRLSTVEIYTHYHLDQLRAAVGA